MAIAKNRSQPEELELLQFPYSHFNEKARWALDHKNVAHRRTNLLPGPHMRRIKALTGQTATPVLVTDGRAVAGSAAILAHLEASHPDPPLFPADPAQRAATGRWQTDLDAELGPALRIVVFAAMLDAGRYVPDMFSTGQGAITRTAYAWSWPLLKPLVRRGNGLTGPGALARAAATTRTWAERIAAAAADTGHLVGDRFTAADLTAAALLAPLANPGHPDMHRPAPLPDHLAALLAAWADHPAIAWTRALYAGFR